MYLQCLQVILVGKRLKRDKTRICAKFNTECLSRFVTRRRNTFKTGGEKEEVITINYSINYSNIIIITITHQQKIDQWDKSFVENSRYGNMKLDVYL